MYGVSYGDGARVTVRGSKEWRTADVSPGEHADLCRSVSEGCILSTLCHTYATIWRATVGLLWQRGSMTLCVCVRVRIPTLVSVWNDGWIRLSRFQRKLENWLMSDHEERNPTRVKDLCMLKVSEQITTAVRQPFCHSSTNFSLSRICAENDHRLCLEGKMFKCPCVM